MTMLALQKLNVETFRPTEKFKSIISSYTVIETADAMETTVLPHLGLVIAIQLSGNVFLKKENKNIPIAAATISGMRNSFRSFVYKPNTTTFLISFTETGAWSIFKDAVFQLFENAEPLESFIKPSIVNELLEKLSLAGPNQEVVGVFEKFLENEISCCETDRLVLTAIDKIYREKGICKIGELSTLLSIGVDAFEKRFRKVVGSTAKQFSTIVKMKEVIKHPGRNISMTDLAYSFDFFDQSHFNKQFKDFTGQTPKQFFRQPYVW